jgi:hypothetical protein
VLLLDHPRALGQFAGLVRKTFPSGRDQVNHELPNSHDDLSNAIAGAAVLASAEEQKIPLVAPLVFGTPRNIPGGSVGQSEHTPQDSGLSTTALYYEWMNSRGGGGGWGPV